MNFNDVQLQLYLVFLSIVYFVLIVFIYRIELRLNKNVFSAVKIQLLFSTIDCICISWFAFNINLLYSTVIPMFTNNFNSPIIIITAYLFNILIFLFTIFGVFLGSYSNLRIVSNLNNLIVKPLNKLNNLNFWFLIYSIALLVFFYTITQMGGFQKIWLQIYLFSEISSGYGYHMAIYVNFLYLSGSGIFFLLIKKERYKLATFIFLMTSVFLVSLGHRSQLATFILIILIGWNFQIKPIKKLINFNTTIIGIFLIVFMNLFVAFRSGEFDDDFSLNTTLSPTEKISRDFFMRLTNLERTIPIVGYFNENPFWYGASYLGLLKAYESSATNPDKPPLDTGVYLNGIANGQVINPPISRTLLPLTSWPEGNLAGYMNFGILGLIIFCILSGLILGLLYNLTIVSKKSFGAVYLFSMLSYMGAPNLSPFGILRLFIFMGIYLIVLSLGTFGKNLSKLINLKRIKI